MMENQSASPTIRGKYKVKSQKKKSSSGEREKDDRTARREKKKCVSGEFNKNEEKVEGKLLITRRDDGKKRSKSANAYKEEQSLDDLKKEEGRKEKEKEKEKEEGKESARREEEKAKERKESARKSDRVHNEGSSLRRVTPLIVGDEIELKECIGKGASGTVWRGSLRGTLVAVKQLKSKYENADQFKKEINIMIQLRHPNVVLFMGACHDPPLIVTEYLEGGDLLTWIEKRKRFRGDNTPLMDMIQISLDIAKGMAWLHQFKPQPIIHKDLKPTNIMLNSQGNAKIIDFGLSEVQKQREMENRRFAGSASWMSPEMLIGKNYTEKIDVYAYGIILWQIFTLSTEVYNINDYQHLPPNTAIQKFIHDIVDQNMRPDLNKEILKNPTIKNLILQSWDSDPNIRPSFSEIIELLHTTRLSSVLKDANAIKLWMNNFSDQDAVPPEKLFQAVWKTLYNKKKPESPNEHILQKALETVITGSTNSNLESVSLDRFGLILHWYGPFESNNSNILLKIIDLLMKPWYHGEINVTEAEELLNTSSGSDNFLIRCSSSSVSPFTLSRSQATPDNSKTVLHHRINFDNKQNYYSIQYQAKDSNIKEVHGTNVEELVEKVKIVLGIKNAVICTKFSKLLTDETNSRYVIAMEDL